MGGHAYVKTFTTDIPSELAACGGEERKEDFRGTPRAPDRGRRPSALLLSPFRIGQEREKDFWGIPPNRRQRAAALYSRFLRRCLVPSDNLLRVSHTHCIIDNT